MFYKNGFLKAIFHLLFLIKIIKSDDSYEKSDMQLKYDACYKLIQLKADKEKVHLSELSTEFNQEDINKILQYTLFECYQNINYYDAEEIDAKNINEIDVYQDTYNDLLNIEKWEDLLKRKDENSMQYALMDLQKAYKDIQSGAIKINRYQKRPSSQKQEKINTNNYSPRDDEEQFNFPADMDRDFSLFGVNFSNLPTSVKNAIGITLIILVFLSVIGGLKWIQSIRGEKDKKKKNKKEKKEKKKAH